MLNSNSSKGGPGQGRGFGIGRSKFSGRTNTLPKTQERELKFSPIQYQGSTPAATYATVLLVRDAIIQQIKKTYKGGSDIGRSLKDMNQLDLTSTEAPTRDIATAADPAVKIVE
jgi:hypothetical protein